MLLVGAVVGPLAKLITGGERDGFLSNTFAGSIGGMLGWLVLAVAHVDLSRGAYVGVAFVGAALVLLLVRFLREV